MNPMMLVQAAGAAAGLIGGFIPDKTRTVETVTNTEGSNLAGLVPGAVGAQSTSTFKDEKYQSDLKKGLLMGSKIAGAVGSIGGALMPNLKMPKLGGTPAAGMNELSSNLVNASLKFSPPKTGVSTAESQFGDMPLDKTYRDSPGGQYEALGELPGDGLVIPPFGRAKGV